MSPDRPRTQFTLRTLFLWTLVIGIQLALIASLPWPLNGYFAPLFAALLAGYCGSRSPWLAVVLGGLWCMIAGMLVAYMQTRAVIGSTLLLMMPCCSFPLGAYIGLGVGMFIRERQNQRRFRANLESLYAELSSARRGEAEQQPTPPESDAPGE